MAEGLLTCTRLDDPPDVIDHTQGRPLCPSDEIRVVDEAGREVPAGAVGELITRGPYTLRGYYKAPETNAAAFTEDGFLRTGDLVRITPEGNLVVEGRVKDVINRGGEKIVSSEVEDLLLEHPAIVEAALVGVPDPIMGEKSCAFIVARGAAPQLPELRTFLKGRGIASYKLPDEVKVLQAMPRTSVGKLNKAMLKSQASADRPIAADG
jgi:2,3-dihydroxybenzoate-AMP ligase